MPNWARSTAWANAPSALTASAKPIPARSPPSKTKFNRATPKNEAENDKKGVKLYKFISVHYNGSPPRLGDTCIYLWECQMLAWFRRDNPDLFEYITSFVHPHENDHPAMRHKRELTSFLKSTGCIPEEYWLDNEPYRAYLRVKILNRRPGDRSLSMHQQRRFQLSCLMISTKSHPTLRSYLTFLKETLEKIRREKIDVVSEPAFFHLALEGIREEFPCWHHNLKRIVASRLIQYDDLCVFFDRQATLEERCLQSAPYHAFNLANPCRHCRLCHACGRQHFSYESPGSMAYKLVLRRRWFGKSSEWSKAQERAVRTLKAQGEDAHAFFLYRGRWGLSLWAWLGGFEVKYPPWPLVVPEVGSYGAVLPWVFENVHGRGQGFSLAGDLIRLGVGGQEPTW